VFVKILYLHGFGSKYDPTQRKVNDLRELGTVIGETIDYTLDPYENIRRVSDICAFEKVDLIVGTSMGGWLANQVGETCGIPYVTLNPALFPSVTLKRQIGEGTKFDGTKFFLSKETVENYPSWRFADSGCGLTLLQEGDELFDAQESYSLLMPYQTAYLFKDGSHRFDDLYKYIPVIGLFYERTYRSYGIETV
jgi:predicted esterase YcpF (UPF0227 family)